MIRNSVFAIVVVLCNGIAFAQSSGSDTCKLDQPPKEAVRRILPGGLEKITFPDPRTIPNKYTGCLNFWLQIVGTPVLMRVVKFKDGVTESVTYPAHRYSCEYTGGKVVSDPAGRGYCEDAKHVTLANWKIRFRQRFEFSMSHNSPAVGAGVPACEKLLDDANGLAELDKVPPPEGRRFSHAISWRDLQRLPEVREPPWKSVEQRHYQPLVLLAFQTGKTALYLHFLDKDSPWLKKYGQSKDMGMLDRLPEALKSELTIAVRDAVLRFIGRGGTAKVLALRDVNPNYTGNLGLVQLEYPPGSPPYPGRFMPNDIVDLEPTMTIGVDATTLEFSREVISLVGERHIVINNEPFVLTQEFGVTILKSTGRAPVRECALEPH